MTRLACSRFLPGALCTLGILAAAAASAQAPAGAPQIKRTEVYRADVAQPGHEAVILKVELAPNGRSGRHTHPGNEISYVVDCDCTLMIDGQPPRKLKAGDGFVIKTGQVHEVRNDANTAGHLIDVYEIEKGKPMSTPAK